MRAFFYKYWLRNVYLNNMGFLKKLGTQEDDAQYLKLRFILLKQQKS